MKAVKATERETGKVVSVLYAANSRGNMRMWVDGKFYSDKQFGKKFEIIHSKD